MENQELKNRLTALKSKAQGFSEDPSFYQAPYHELEDAVMLESLEIIYSTCMEIYSSESNLDFNGITLNMIHEAAVAGLTGRTVEPDMKRWYE